ncbi:MAG: DUF4920 domain-containing protein [Acidobacteriota bacterium]
MPQRRLRRPRPVARVLEAPEPPWRMILLLGTLMLLMLWSLGAAAGEEGKAEAAVYGDGVTVEEKTAIAEVLADPDAWEGRTVRVEGEVTDVCPKKGCWMSLREGEAAVRIKVEDDVIIFPGSAVGSHAVAQGTVNVLDLDRERYTGWLAHLAEERGETFDESTVGEGPYRIVQIAGSGAEIGE